MKKIQIYFLTILISFCGYAGPRVGNKETGKVYILSVGVNQSIEKEGISLFAKNAESDAIQFCTNTNTKSDSLRGATFQLLGAKAVKEKVFEAINFIIEHAKKEDRFYFYFGGISFAFEDPLGQDDILFGLANFDGDLENNDKKNDRITLSELVNLFSLISCERQFIMSEAGTSEYFGKIITRKLIEQSRELSEVSNRNRVVLTTEKYGLDHFGKIQMGPLMYYFTKICEAGNLDLAFSDQGKFDFELHKVEVSQSYSSEKYVRIIFERQIIDDLGLGSMKTGNATNNKISIKPMLGSEVGKTYAVFVSVTNYAPNSGWKNLTNPLLDANELSKMLASEYSFDTLHLRNPTKNQIFENLISIAKKIKSNDQLLFYFNGHGYFDTLLYNDGFFAISESLHPSKDLSMESYISFSSIRSIFDHLKSKQVMLLIDACFGGTMDEEQINIDQSKKTFNPLKTLELADMLNMNNMKVEWEGDALGLSYQDRSYLSYVKQTLGRNTRVVLSAGSDEVPEGYKGEHSPMTLRLLQLLSYKGGTKPFLTSSNLYDAVKLLPSQPVIGALPSDQRGEFVFFPTFKN